MNAQLLVLAENIGSRLLETCIEMDHGVSWMTSPARLGEKSVTVIADGSVYGGTAGIALYLAELAALTDEQKFADCAVLALRHAIHNRKDSVRNPASFFAGIAGLLFVAVRIGGILNAPCLVKDAALWCSDIEQAVASDFQLDVVGGSAGAIAPMLVVAKELNSHRVFTIAAQMADRLSALAEVGPLGAQWSPRITGSRQLCGLAHGASGIGVALLEAYANYGNPTYLELGDLAFAYEAHKFDVEMGTWPDLRVPSFVPEEFEGSEKPASAFRAAIDTLSDTRGKSMTAWCHGAAGIALARLRAWQLFGRDTDLCHAQLAVAQTRRAILTSEAAGLSLCHGLAGNCCIAIEGGRTLGAESLSLEASAILLERLTPLMLGEDWRLRSGRPTGAPDPSLMVGDAGVGYACLLAAGAVTNSVLLTKSSVATSTIPSHSYFMLQSGIEQCTPHCLALIRSEVEPKNAAIITSDSGGSAPIDFLTMLKSRLSSSPVDSTSIYLKEMLLRDQARCDVMLIDANALIIERRFGKWCQTKFGENALYRLSIGSRVTVGTGLGSTVSATSVAPLLIWKSLHDVLEQEVGLFDFTLLLTLAEPLSASALSMALCEVFLVSNAEHLRAIAVGRLIEFVGAGIVVAVPPEGPDGPSSILQY